MELPDAVLDKRDDILRLATEHGARHVRVFGSAARGEAGPDSDVDFLVEMEPHRSLLDRSRRLLDLEDLLGRPVDVVEPEGLHRLIRGRVLSEAVALGPARQTTRSTSRTSANAWSGSPSTRGAAGTIS